MVVRLVTKNILYYGDNLEVLRKYIKDETVDLCYIDPPFNSKRNYNQIYNNIGSEDRAQAQAFIDTWVWDERADEGYSEILANDQGRFTLQVVDLLKGLQPVLKKGSLLAYLVSITLRVTEIHRVLKPTGSFYLHCDPTASHYLKLILDAIFVANGGDYRNEIIWAYESGGRPKQDFGRKHDVIFRYTKSKQWVFNSNDIGLSRQLTRRNHMKRGIDEDGRVFHSIRSAGKIYKYYDDEGVIPSDVWTEFSHLQQKDPERLGYPTQKPEALLERIIKVSSNEGDMVLDAYCGCGTTIAVAERLKRQWIGIDITYQSIALILRRLEGQYGADILNNITLNGIPRDMDSAKALALKKDDRVRKEFEKWAVLTYTNNRAIINDKKGGDKGIDGTAFFLTGKDENAKIVFQVKSGTVGRGDVSKLNNDRVREGAELAVFITLAPPTKGMRDEASAAGFYTHDLMNRSYPRIEIVTIEERIEQHKRLDIPMSFEVLKKAQAVEMKDMQPELFTSE